MRVLIVAFAFLSLSAVACSKAPTDTGGTGKAPAPAPSQSFSPQPYGSLAQIMRGINFPSSNLIFDTQTNDPGKPKKLAGGTEGGATSTFAGVYSGWQVVENAAVAVSEMANLIQIPGRLCENGKPVPLDREDFRKFSQGLADAGKAALKAAQSKNLDAMVDVSGTVTEACAACHEVYRDKTADNKDRCTP